MKTIISVELHSAVTMHGGGKIAGATTINQSKQPGVVITAGEYGIDVAMGHRSILVPWANVKNAQYEEAKPVVKAVK